jgi:acetolactate synthase-1/2/3 large subunit
MKYSDYFVEQLLERGYTTVFYVAGGNIMHLLNSCRTRIACIPVVHEVSAVIAAEYFNETTDERAFALVTAGPGLTNCVTGIAGAWLESRGVLIVGGQVKSSDLMGDTGVRQNGIQEINGVEIVQSICKKAVCLDKAISANELKDLFDFAFEDRPGPVFIEFCLDIQAIELDSRESISFTEDGILPKSNVEDFDPDQLVDELQKYLDKSTRPIVLLGGGVSRTLSSEYLLVLEKLGIPVMTTWNGADRVPARHPLYLGRPNTWGQRSANIILQQADLLVAIGTRLGLQQTGFNWQEFMPSGSIIQIDVDESELMKHHPVIGRGIRIGSEKFLSIFSRLTLKNSLDVSSWLKFSQEVRSLIPSNDSENSNHPGFVNPFEFVTALSKVVPNDALVVPCSSGGAFTTMMQAFEQSGLQKIVTNKGLASMGYGLAGALGASIANPDKIVILVEGDGGFAQNLQELGTVASNKSKMKIFIYSNQGYASIRMTQKSYFDGAYMGCDVETGLGLPNWELIFSAYNISCKNLNLGMMQTTQFLRELNDDKARAYIVPVHPDQTFYPKITSKILEDGSMQSNPIHLMTPELDGVISQSVFRYLTV